ncbi:MAG: NRDE family protein [Ignavibacteriaceae bacterium]
MCLLLISYKNHPKYKLIVAANRDEFYKRPASPAHFWGDTPDLLAGKDLEAGGTWLGLTKSGNFSAITNYRDMKNMKKDAPTRGKLVTDFLLNNFSPSNYSKLLKEKSDLYNGYNLIFGDKQSMNYFSNQTKTLIELTPGIYGLSNHLLDTPWYKVEKSKKSFSKVLMKKNIDAGDLFEILSDTSIPPDDMLPDTGVGLDVERAVSPVFVATPSYGTRSSTVIFIDMENHVTFVEKSLNSVSGKWIKLSFKFEILDSNSD